MPVYPFFKAMDSLIEQSRLQGAAASLPGVVRRPWAIPPDAPTTGIDIEDPNFFRIACDRTELNGMAVAAYETGNGPNAGRVGTVMASKKAIDYQAGCERALRGRYASAVQRRIWAMARKTGHGSPTYGVFGAIRRELETLLDEAVALPNSPEGVVDEPSNSSEE